MVPDHRDHGSEISSLILARLRKNFLDWDFSLRDMALSYVLDALEVLEWSFEHCWVEHPDNFEWGRTYTYGTGTWGAQAAERYLLHVPGEVMVDPSSAQFSQVEEAIASIMHKNMCILLFSWDTDFDARPFRSMQRRYRKLDVDVDFKPWTDVKEFHHAHDAEAHLPIIARRRSRSLAAKLLNLD